jgi:hypothetical protein
MEYPLYLTITAIVSRFFLIIMGAEWWIYGYMIIFIYYGTILAVVIGKKRFPFENAFKEVNLEKIAFQRKEIDISRVPEFLFAFICIVMASLVGILVILKPSGVPLPSLKIGKVEYNFYIVALFTLLLVITIFCIYITYRLFTRKKREIRS